MKKSILILALTLLFSSLGHSQNSNGKIAPKFEMTDVNGNSITSENTKGKIVILNFWFTTCKPCIEEMPELNEIYKKYKSNPNIVFASVTFESKRKTSAFLKRKSFDYPLVVDAREVCDLFQVNGYPTNLILKDGKIYDSILGGSPGIGRRISTSIQAAIENKKNPNSGRGSSNSSPIRLDMNTKFVLENGKTVPLKKAIDLLNSRKYGLIPKKDKDGNQYYLLKKN